MEEKSQARIGDQAAPASSAGSAPMWGLFHRVGSGSFISQVLARVTFSRIVKIKRAIMGLKVLCGGKKPSAQAGNVSVCGLQPA